MRIHIAFSTVYAYDRPSKAIVQRLRLTPRAHEGQHVSAWRIETDTDSRLKSGEDAFGNIIHMLSVAGPIESLAVNVIGDVETTNTNGIVRGTVERLPEEVYLRETPLTACDDALGIFARRAARGSERDELSVLHRLLAAIHDELTFDTQPTTSLTTAAEAFAMRSGVCQDLTHIFLACARHLRIPARYVSGHFLRADGLTEQEASHAWAEAKIPGLGWVGFDPANGICPTDAHVRVATALDYLGAAPVRGSRLGGGEEKLTVGVHVSDGSRQAQS
ncbi:transglutaminase-like putative cysteine protease [Rhodoligotrophos appendicifer]|uniref:transglutaminase family protein n=1 Tax=Rhodoligotrophos appendicifer TaxID=987056 RepID=UPI00118633F6|nr:transglutaminase family protein [Rhodoligotrophos appendicifer]